MDTELLQKRIRERAYYLATNRTGRAWWDASSNWLEAEETERALAAREDRKEPPFGDSIEFRPRAILRIFTPTENAASGLLIGLNIAPLLALLSIAYHKLVWHWFEHWLLALVTLTAAGFLLLAQTRRWWKHRSELYDREHFFVLTIFAACLSTYFAAANYFLYRWNENAFAFDSTVKTAFEKARADDKAKGIVRTKTIQAECQRLATELDGVDSALQTHGWYQNLTDVTTMDVGADHFRMEGDVNERGGSIVYTLSVHTPAVTFDVSALEAGRLRADMTAKDLANVLRRRAGWEFTQEQIPIETEATSGATIGVFVYQSLMDVFQSNPNYMKPVTVGARCLTLLYAFAVRFLFVGILLSLLAKGFGAKKK
jgi:hypothetical protein